MFQLAVRVGAAKGPFGAVAGSGDSAAGCRVCEKSGSRCYSNIFKKDTTTTYKNGTGVDQVTALLL